MPWNGGPTCGGILDRLAAESWTDMAWNTQNAIPGRPVDQRDRTPVRISLKVNACFG